MAAKRLQYALQSRGPWATALRRSARDQAAHGGTLLVFVLIVVLCLLAPAYAAWAGVDPFRSTLDATDQRSTARTVPVMEQSTEGLGLGYNADRPDLASSATISSAPTIRAAMSWRACSMAAATRC